MKRTWPTYRAFLLLALVASVAGDDELFPDDEPSLGLSLKEKCPERPDRLACLYWASLTDSEEPLRDSAAADEDASRGFLPDDPKEKRFTVFRRHNPVAQGYKRGPGFRSWGGKRDPLYFDRDPDKRNKFASWGGKRDGEYYSEEASPPAAPEKRTKFVSWGGKRDPPEAPVEKRGLWSYRALYPSESFKKHLPKRPQFQSWGGKRTFRPWDDLLQIHPQQFLYTGEKRKFSSWGGKRSGDPEGEPAKRHTFQNWGGKRAPDEAEDGVPKDKDPEERDKREAAKSGRDTAESHFGFNSWGGKRGGEANGR